MADGFHIDGSGNLWIGSTSNTFDNNAPFYVETDGTIQASSGTIGGLELASTYIESSNYSSSSETGYRLQSDGDAQFYGTLTATDLNATGATISGTITASDGTIGGIDINTSDIQSSNYSNTSGSEAGFKITDNGDAFFNSVDIRVKESGASEGDVPSDGTQSIQIGSAQIYESNNNLYLNSNSSGSKIIISAGDKFVLSGSSANPNLTFDGASTQDIEFNAAYVSDGSTSDGRSYSSDPLGQIYELTISNQNADIYRVNAQNNDVYFYGDVEVDGHIEVNSLKVYDGFGSSGEVLTRTTNGLEWAAAGGAHADSDHTSFANSSHNHTESDISDIGSHSHSNLDNYQKWILKGNGNNLNVLTGYGVEFKAGSGISLFSGFQIALSAKAPSLKGLGLPFLSKSTKNDASFQVFGVI